MHGAVDFTIGPLADDSARQMPLTRMNVLSGGKQTANTLDFRNFTIAPLGALSTAEALRICTEVYQAIKDSLQRLGRSTRISNEGGFMPNFVSNEEALAVIIAAIQKAGYKAGENIGLILDVAASDYFENGEYNFPGEGFIKTPAEMVEYYARLVEEYPILSIQGGMAENDREGWALLRKRLNSQTLLLQ